MRPRFPLVTLLIACVTATAGAGTAFAQSRSRPVDRYLNYDDARTVATKTPRSPADIGQVLPERQASRFAEYMREKFAGGASVEALREGVEHLRLNKIVGGGASGAGSTSLVSQVAVPGLVGFATEYGGIVQAGSGNTTTLRANVLGLANVLAGAEQFPYCPEIDAKNCQPGTRWLRRISLAASFESTPTGGEHLTSWSARFDLTANDPENPAFVGAWTEAIATLRGGQAGLDLTKAISDLFADAQGTMTPLYLTWRAEAVTALASVPTDEFSDRVGQQLDVLIGRMAADTTFMSRVAAVSRASRAYFDARDSVLRAIQRHRMSLDVTNQHPASQPWMSNWKFIYSDQPSQGPTLVTANVAATFYAGNLGGVSTRRLRDVQVAAQLDRRLGEIPSLGAAVATLGVYGEWLRDDAVVSIPGGVPGTGAVLPDITGTVPFTKGAIGVLQAKLTVPVAGVVKVPLSISWSSRTELGLGRHEWRGQAGFTLDLDSLFK